MAQAFLYIALDKFKETIRAENSCWFEVKIGWKLPKFSQSFNWLVGSDYQMRKVPYTKFSKLAHKSEGSFSFFLSFQQNNYVSTDEQS